MELRVRVKDIQWGALILFVLYTVVVMCFLFNEIERQAGEDKYAKGQIKLVWNSKNRADFFLSHNDHGGEWFDASKEEWPEWMQKLRKEGFRVRKHEGGHKYFLSAFTSTQTEFKPKSLENLPRDVASLKQWIHYLLVAGVDHIYICDSHEFEENHLGRYLWKFMGYGLLTYYPSHHNNSEGVNLQKAQANCYRELTPVLKKDTKWLISLDVLDYPYVVDDQSEGFLYRHLKDLVQGRNYTDIMMNQTQIAGPGDQSQPVIVDRGQFIEQTAEAHIVAPLYRPDSRIPLPNPEHTNGKEIKHPQNQNYINATKSHKMLLMNYDKTVKGTFVETENLKSLGELKKMSEISHKLRQSLRAFGEQDAFL